MECDSTFDNTIDGPLSVSNPAVVYAELLLNIRQVSVFISLPTPSSPETRAELSSDRLSFSVAHDGRVSTLQLPTKVAEPPPLNPPPIPTKELSFRLPLAQSANQTTNADSDNVVPWTATSLAATAVLSCRKCGVTLVEARTIKAWKDLPSENWAEMMEFWHCHKPREHSNPSESNHVGKGYTASEKITADTALGLVDLCYFLLSEKDCSGVKVATQNTTKRQLQALACVSCQAIVGATDERAEGWRLYKWGLAVQPAEGINIERFRTDFFVSAYLLALIDTQGTRKFIIETDGATPILLWVFNTNLRYTISNSLSGSQRAMKVFYQTHNITIGQLGSKVQTAPLSPEEVYLPLHIHQQLRERLHGSNRSLPTSARKFQEWDIGLLGRFENDA
ncbi:MAG: hypothetical protein M1813_002758 [Trichoglossum hirsutum]|nr:MAG: hypothetical protein M1813_002758 [Trichoglossum hirsutum]